MAIGRKSKSVTISMPKTGWREPARARDDLLSMPKGRLLTPTDEVYTIVLAKAVSGTKVMSLYEERSSSVLSDADSEASLGQLDQIVEQLVDYDGDVEGHDAPAHVLNSSSLSSEEDLTIVPKADDDLDNDELLAGEEPDDKEEALPKPVASSPQPVPASKHRAKALRDGTERIQPHPKDPTKIVVRYCCRDPAGGIYTQETEMPQVVSDSAGVAPGMDGVIFPDVETSKVPRTKRGSPWTPVHIDSKYEWTRGAGERQETWRVNIFFRRLDRDTHAFQDIYVNTNILKNVDPNDKIFRTSYNKWILQFARRRDASYTQKVVRVHWSVDERRALYTSINTFCAKFGVHRLGFTEECKLNTKQLQLMADAVNDVPNALRVAPRGVDAVRGQIVSAHDKTQPKNKALYDLMKKAQALRARLAGGEQISKAERKPRLAISLSEFPVNPPVAAPGLSTLSGRKRKRTAVEVLDTESCDSELSSPPTSEVGEDDRVRGGDTWMATDEANQPGESEEGNWSDTSEVSWGEKRAVVEQEISSSPPAKKARTT